MEASLPTLGELERKEAEELSPADVKRMAMLRSRSDIKVANSSS